MCEAPLTQHKRTNARHATRREQDKNYARNVAKAGKFEDYTDFYIKRGTDTSGSWIKVSTVWIVWLPGRDFKLDDEIFKNKETSDYGDFHVQYVREVL